MKLIGINIGGTYFRIGLCDGENVLNYQKVLTTSVFKNDDAILDLANYIKEYAKDMSFDAIVIGFPATLDKRRKTVLQAPNLRFIENLPVVCRLEELLNVEVRIERDVNLEIFYDLNKYKIPYEKGTVTAFYFGTGIGNALMFDGRLYLGKNGVSGELGHIPVFGSEVECGCGNVGCIENLAGGKYLVKLTYEYFKDDKIDEIFTKHKDDIKIKEYLDMMALAITSEINILDPDYILIGGGVINMVDFPKNLLTERILDRTRKPYPANNLEIIYVEDDDFKSILGAYFYYERNYQK